MFSSLKNHPFPVEAFFDSSLVLTFAAPQEQIAHLLPPYLELDLFQNRWAFLAAALVQTRNMRPKGFPPLFGQNFLLAGFRLFVRHTAADGKRRRGLYILKSATDKRRMAFAGNLLTHYNYEHTDIVLSREAGRLQIKSLRSDLWIDADIAEENPPLPPQSPFADWSEARRFAGPMPFTFSFDPHSQRIVIIEGVRQHWQPRPVRILKHHIGFFSRLDIPGLVLANAFIVENIPYHWKKGITEKWPREDISSKD